MANYYSNSVDYHNDLDAFEARVRAEEAERELNKKQPAPKPLFCCCLEREGDNDDCPIHGAVNDDSTAWDKERDELRTMGQGG